MFVYMKITKDKYELPLCIADSPSELAEITGDSITTINPQISRANTGDERYGRSGYLKVEIEKDEQKNAYDEVRLIELWKENQQRFTKIFSLKEFLIFCYEWDSMCERLRSTPKRRLRA